MYLDLKEYKLRTFQDISEFTDEELEKMIYHAEELLDVQTRYFYHSVDFDTDKELRKNAVKRALTAQVDYYVESGFTSVYGLNTDATSISLGRTSITKNGNGGKAQEFTNLTGLCVEFWQNLQGTGLLYRGCN